MRVHKVPGKGFYARVGDFFGPLREVQSAAIKALDEELEAFHPLNHDYIRCMDGTVLHIYQIPTHGWNIAIVPVSGYTGQGVGVQGTRAQANKRAKAWAEKNAGGVA